MPTKYRVYYDTIAKVEVIGETPTMVTLQHPTYTGRVQRERKERDYVFWADTWEEAHEWMVKNAYERMVVSEQLAKSAGDHLERIKNMKKPIE